MWALQAHPIGFHGRDSARNNLLPRQWREQGNTMSAKFDENSTVKIKVCDVEVCWSDSIKPVWKKLETKNFHGQRARSMTRIQGAVPQTSCGSTSTNQVSRARPRPKYLQCQVVYLVTSLPRACPEGCALRFHGFPVKRDTRDWRHTNGQETKSPASFNDSIHFCSSLDTFQTIQHNSR